MRKYEHSTQPTATNKRIGELEDELKARDRRIEELRSELDEQRDLVRRMEEQVEDADNVIESWVETFGMEMTTDGAWTWQPFWQEHHKLVDRCTELTHLWNKYEPRLRGELRNIGRPLAASASQQAAALRLNKAGMSLRAIANELTLSLQTVRTIVAKANGTDRTTRRHRRRLSEVELDTLLLPLDFGR
jgi:uncharacterized coiled-coil protein SlyX